MGHMILQQRAECDVCKGRGYLLNEKEVDVDIHIPIGGVTGDAVTVNGVGHEYPGHEVGDLIVILRQLKHDDYSRKGADLGITHRLSLREALCGFKMRVKHPSGKNLVIESGTPNDIVQPGSLWRVLSMGMPQRYSPHIKGHLYIIMDVEIQLNDVVNDQFINDIKKALPDYTVDNTECDEYMNQTIKPDNETTNDDDTKNDDTKDNITENTNDDNKDDPNNDITNNDSNETTTKPANKATNDTNNTENSETINKPANKVTNDDTTNETTNNNPNETTNEATNDDAKTTTDNGTNNDTTTDTTNEPNNDSNIPKKPKPNDDDTKEVTNDNNNDNNNNDSITDEIEIVDVETTAVDDNPKATPYASPDIRDEEYGGQRVQCQQM